MQVPVIRYDSSRDTVYPHLQFRQDRVYSSLYAAVNIKNKKKIKKKVKDGQGIILTKNLVMGYTSDSLPHIGVVPNVDVESFPPSPPLSSPPTPSTTTAPSNLLSKLGGIKSNRSGSKFIAAGFNGHGMPVIFRATEALASMILHGKRFEETGLPGVYETTLDRLKDEQDDHQEA